MHHKIQSKIPYERSQNWLHDEEGHSLVAYPKTQNMTESLDLIQFKCYQDILKQKQDNRARDMPLSYSKSIQYLGQETGMFMKFREPSGTLDEKCSTVKLSQNPSKETKSIFEITSKSSDGQIPVLKDKDYWSPVNIRVQKLIQRAQQRDDVTKQHKIIHSKSQSQQQFYPVASQSNESSDQIKESNQGYEDFNQNVVNNEDQNMLASDLKSSTLSQTNNNSRFLSTFVSKKISANRSHSPDSMLFLKEQYALKSMEKSSIGNINKAEEQSHQKQFAPLKLCPPFIRHSYGSKSPLFQMGLLRNERPIELPQRPGVIHANNNLRSSWQNRVGNSTAKSSVHEEQTYFPLSKSKSSTNGFGLTHSSRFSVNFQQPLSFNIKTIKPENTSEIDEHKNNVDQLLEYVSQEQENDKNQLNPIQLSNKRHKECNENHSTMQLTSSLSQLRQDGFNHFFNSNLLKNDLDHSNHQDKTNSHINNKMPFKQNSSLSSAEILIQNQLPGSKLTSKRIRQQNYSSLNFSQEDSNKKVYFTLPDRGNFFKNKSIGFAGQILRRDRSEK